MAASPGQDFLLLGGTDRRRLEAVYTLLLYRQAWVTELKAAGWVLQLAAASAGAGPVVFLALSRALRVQSLACPHLPGSPMRPSWTQRSPPLLLLVSHILGEKRMVASSGQNFLVLGVADRRRLEAEYTLLLCQFQC